MYHQQEWLFASLQSQIMKVGEIRKQLISLIVQRLKATAEAIANYTHKGSKVLIDGKVQLGSYEKKDGSGKQNTTDIIVNQIEVFRQ